MYLGKRYISLAPQSSIASKCDLLTALFVEDSHFFPRFFLLTAFSESSLSVSRDLLVSGGSLSTSRMAALRDAWLAWDPFCLNPLAGSCLQLAELWFNEFICSLGLLKQ